MISQISPGKPIPSPIEKRLYDLYLYLRDGLQTRRGDSQGSFSARLFHLMFKCDPANLAKLALAFPEHHAAFQIWQHSEDEDELWARHGFGNAGVKKGRA